MILADSDTPAAADSRSQATNELTAGHTITLVHLSDPHINCMNTVRVQDLFSKRIFGYLRWKLHRSAEHGSGILAALQEDLTLTKPDHIAVTGDLTHLSLPAEFIKARQWLESLGPPDQVTVIPGNHDAYVKNGWRQGWAGWTGYMLGDECGDNDYAVRHPESIFPSLRVRGPMALIGVCTARPSALHLAVGTVGPGQLQKLETVLAQASKAQLYRVLLIHHPPAPGTVSWRKRLTDADALQSLIARRGAELILHGHAHRVLHNYLKTPGNRAPVIGASSVSAIGRTPDRRARYYIYRITRGTKNWDVELTVRIYSTDRNCFITEREQRISSRR